MDYGKIISTGFTQAWKYKSLWVLGFLAGGGIGNIPTDRMKGTGDAGDFFNWRGLFDGGGFNALGLGDFLAGNILLILAIIGAFLLVGFIFFILHFMALGGLIDAGGVLKRKGQYSLGSSFQAGISRFWQLLGLGLLLFLVVIAALAVMIGIGVAVFLISTPLGFLSLIFLIPVSIVFIYFTSMVNLYAERLIILEKRPVFDSIADGYTMFTNNLGPSTLYFLVLMGISIAAAIGVFVIMAGVAIPFVALGFVQIWVALLLGIPTVLVILFLVSGYTGAAINLMSTEFYFQVAERGKARPDEAALATSPPLGMPPSGTSPPPPPPQTTPPPSGTSPSGTTPPPATDPPLHPLHPLRGLRRPVNR